MDQIGRIRIDREIGRGGMGVVYQGYDPFLERPVAVKSLLAPHRLAGPQDGSEDWPTSVKRLELEARAAARLNHPNIVAVYDVLPAADSFCVVMEFVEGRNLDAAAPEGSTAPAAFVTKVVQECAAALDHAHSRGVVHRDIKPSNIMLDQNGAAKITDFGIAKLADSTAELTQGQAIGTFSYMSPEQLTGQVVDGRSDQYSLAVVACRLLTGMRQRPAAPSALNPSLNTRVDAVLDRAMSLAPGDRYETCSRFAQELALALDPVAPTVVVPPKPARKSGWVIAGTAVVLAGVGALFLIRGKSQPVTEKPVVVAAAAVKSPEPAAEIPKPAEPTPTAPPTPPTPAPVKDSPPPKAAEVAKPAAASIVVPVANGESKVNPKDGLPYIWIPPGTFSMGCSSMDAECNADEKPVHKVTLTKGFWIGKTEVTQDAFQRVRGNNPSYSPGAGLPVEKVPWGGARAYCEAVGMRLPTEAEWEYAARGSDLSSRYGAPNAVAWYFGDSDKHSHPVGEKRANGFGLHDMLGNVWEWVADTYGPYSAEAAMDPLGPAGGENKVVRGAAWDSLRKKVRVSVRDKNVPTYRYYTIGFRCAGGSL